MNTHRLDVSQFEHTQPEVTHCWPDVDAEEPRKSTRVVCFFMWASWFLMWVSLVTFVLKIMTDGAWFASLANMLGHAWLYSEWRDMLAEMEAA